MRNCENGVCGFIDGCMLGEYLSERKKPRTLRDRAEAAVTYDLLAEKCPISDQLQSKYAKELKDSRAAQQRLRKKK